LALSQVFPKMFPIGRAPNYNCRYCSGSDVVIITSDATAWLVRGRYVYASVLFLGVPFDPASCLDPSKGNVSRAIRNRERCMGNDSTKPNLKDVLASAQTGSIIAANPEVVDIIQPDRDRERRVRLPCWTTAHARKQLRVLAAAEALPNYPRLAFRWDVGEARHMVLQTASYRAALKLTRHSLSASSPLEAGDPQIPPHQTASCGSSGRARG
jgi:hypothetical protein